MFAFFLFSMQVCRFQKPSLSHFSISFTNCVIPNNIDLLLEFTCIPLYIQIFQKQSSINSMISFLVPDPLTVRKAQKGYTTFGF